MRAAVGGLTALLLTGAAVAGCQGSSTEAEASSPAAATASATVDAGVVWAGQVCLARDNVSAAVGGLGRNLSYDVSADRSALDQIQRQLGLQVVALADSVDKLGATLQEVPVDIQQANDFVATTTRAAGDTKQAVNEASGHVQAAAQADNVLQAVSEVSQAVIAAKAAFEAGQVLVSAVSDAGSSANESLSAAFAAAPECQPKEQ